MCAVANLPAPPNRGGLASAAMPRCRHGLLLKVQVGVPRGAKFTAALEGLVDKSAAGWPEEGEEAFYPKLGIGFYGLYGVQRGILKVGQMVTGAVPSRADQVLRAGISAPSKLQRQVMQVLAGLHRAPQPLGEVANGAVPRDETQGGWWDRAVLLLKSLAMPVKGWFGHVQAGGAEMESSALRVDPRTDSVILLDRPGERPLFRL